MCQSLWSGNLQNLFTFFNLKSRKNAKTWVKSPVLKHRVKPTPNKPQFITSRRKFLISLICDDLHWQWSNEKEVART